MGNVVSLVLPFFGLILIGAVAARAVRLPETALGWLNVFVIHIALPALFFQMLSRTPIDQLTEWTYIAGAVLATYIVFSLMFAGSLLHSGGNVAESAIKAFAASYGNIGYMGPGIALLALGPEAAVPVALIVCFENLAHFSVLPFLMAMSGQSGRPLHPVALEAVRKVLLHPFIIGSALGIAAAALELEIPLPLDRLLATWRMPCALRPFRDGGDAGPAAAEARPGGAGADHSPQARRPSRGLLSRALADRRFSPVWVWTAVLLAGLPSAAMYVIAQQYGVWVERASAAILVTTLVSVLTMTLILGSFRAACCRPTHSSQDDRRAERKPLPAACLPA